MLLIFFQRNKSKSLGWKSAFLPLFCRFLLKWSFWICILPPWVANRNNSIQDQALKWQSRPGSSHYHHHLWLWLCFFVRLCYFNSRYNRTSKKHHFCLINPPNIFPKVLGNLMILTLADITVAFLFLLVSCGFHLAFPPPLDTIFV